MLSDAHIVRCLTIILTLTMIQAEGQGLMQEPRGSRASEYEAAWVPLGWSMIKDDMPPAHCWKRHGGPWRSPSKMICKINRKVYGCTSFNGLFMELKEEFDGVCAWHYESGYHAVIQSSGCVVRRSACMALQVTVQPTLSGRDRVSAYTLGGRECFVSYYGLFQECRLFQFRSAVRAHMIQTQMATAVTKLSFILNSDFKVLRGNCILKKAGMLRGNVQQKWKPKERYRRRSPNRNMRITDFFKRTHLAG